MVFPKCFSCPFFLALVFFGASPSVAQPAVTATLSNVTRVESWSYFQPRVEPQTETPVTIGDPDYTFLGNRAELGVSVAGKRFDLSGAFNYVRLENLPPDAIGPGGLGTGAFYFAASGVRYSYQLYLGELTARIRVGDRTSITIGRMPFSSGGEFQSSNMALQEIKTERLQSRLIGNFEWSFYQRRFDGVRVDVDRTQWHVTGAAFIPTQGGFEESTNLSMPDLQLASLATTRKGAAAEYQLFGYVYRDRRGTAAVVDNSGSTDRPVDVTVATAGASYARVTQVGSGALDVLAWGALQGGDWYGRSHRAGSVAAEAGYRWTGRAARPWLRVGYLWASGDNDGGDDRHGTFFQMLPSSRKYALSSVYAQMNLNDLFAQFLAEPRGWRTKFEVHSLHLASGADLWYQGSGATASKGRFFGFSGRAAQGDTALGTMIEGTVEVPIRKHWSVNLYGGTMLANAVVVNMFTTRRLTLWSLENVVRF